MNVSRRRAEEAARRTKVLIGGVVGAIALALVVVFALAIAGSVDEDADYRSAIVQGAPLAPLDRNDPGGGADPVVGLAAPVVEGYDLEGLRTTIGSSDRPTVVVLLAHWCPHCQRDVPEVVSWYGALDPTTAPRLVAVATAIDPSAPNHPPEAWLDREGWPGEVIYDPADEVPAAYGSSGFPFFVVLDEDGVVLRRLSGEIDPSVLDQFVDAGR